MNKPHILLPMTVTGLILAAALATAALVNAADMPRPAVVQAALPPAEVNPSLFEIAPLSVGMRCRMIQADPVLQQAEVAALFNVAPLTVKMRSKLVSADARLIQAEVAALFDPAPVSARAAKLN